MITLNWKPMDICGGRYYYTFYEAKFWCVNAEHVWNGISDHDFIFQVTTEMMDEQTRVAFIKRLADLFPELNLQQIRCSLGL